MSGELSPSDAGAGSTEVKPGEEPRRRQIPLHSKILIGLAVGIVMGLVANEIGARSYPKGSPHTAGLHGFTTQAALQSVVVVAETVGRVFLRLMFMVVLPLVFSALALAVVEIGDIRQLGQVGLRTL